MKVINTFSKMLDKRVLSRKKRTRNHNSTDRNTSDLSSLAEDRGNTPNDDKNCDHIENGNSIEQALLNGPF